MPSRLGLDHLLNVYLRQRETRWTSIECFGCVSWHTFFGQGEDVRETALGTSLRSASERRTNVTGTISSVHSGFSKSGLVSDPEPHVLTQIQANTTPDARTTTGHDECSWRTLRNTRVVWKPDFRLKRRSRGGSVLVSNFSTRLLEFWRRASHLFTLTVNNPRAGTPLERPVLVSITQWSGAARCCQSVPTETCTPPNLP